MSVTARILRALVASPGDCLEERDVVSEALERWNRNFGRLLDVRVESNRWELDTHPHLGFSPQDSINRQIVDTADLVVAVFWHRLGTTTESADSGTAEEIQRFVNTRRPALVYFSSRPADLSGIDLDQLQLLRSYRKKLEKNGLTASFASVGELRDRVERDIGLVLQGLLREESLQTLREVVGSPAPIRAQQYAAKSPEARDYQTVYDVSDAASFYNAMASIYDARQSDQLLDSQYKVISRLSDFLSGRARRSVLDLGCGTGEEIATHFAHRSDLKWFCVDESMAMVSRFVHNMRRSDMTVTPIIADAREQVASLLEDNRQFDAIVLSWLLSSLPSDISWTELRALLKPEGRLIVADAHPENLLKHPLYGVELGKQRIALRLRSIVPSELVRAAVRAGLFLRDPSEIIVKADGSPYAFVQEFTRADTGDRGRS